MTMFFNYFWWFLLGSVLLFGGAAVIVLMIVDGVKNKNKTDEEVGLEILQEQRAQEIQAIFRERELERARKEMLTRERGMKKARRRREKAGQRLEGGDTLTFSKDELRIQKEIEAALSAQDDELISEWREIVDGL